MKYIRLFPLLFLCAWTPASGDVTKLSNAERVILEGYAAALAILPEGVQQDIQKKLGLWVRDNQGGSIWANIQVSGSVPYQSIRATVLENSSYVYGCSYSINSYPLFVNTDKFQSETCVRVGIVANVNGNTNMPLPGGVYVQASNNTSDWYAMIATPAPQPNSTLNAQCVVGRSYASALARYTTQWDSGDWYQDVLYYIPAGNCQLSAFTESPRVLLDIPFSANLQDTSSMLSVLKAAQAASLDIPDISTNTNAPFSLAKSTSIAAAIDYIEDGVVVDGPIGQTSSIVPDTVFSGVSSGTYSTSGSSVSVNVTVNVSTAEIVNRLDQLHDDLLAGTTETATTLGDYKKSLIDQALAQVDTSTYTSILNQFTIPIASTSWQPCFELSWSGLWGAADQTICVSDWPNWNGVILPLIQFALVFSTGLWCLIYMWEGN